MPRPRSLALVVMADMALDVAAAFLAAAAVGIAPLLIVRCHR